MQGTGNSEMQSASVPLNSTDLCRNSLMLNCGNVYIGFSPLFAVHLYDAKQILTVYKIQVWHMFKLLSYNFKYVLINAYETFHLDIMSTSLMLCTSLFWCLKSRNSSWHSVQGELWRCDIRHKDVSRSPERCEIWLPWDCGQQWAMAALNIVAIFGINRRE